MSFKKEACLPFHSHSHFLLAKENDNDGILNLDSEVLANLGPLMALCRVP